MLNAMHNMHNAAGEKKNIILLRRFCKPGWKNAPPQYSLLNIADEKTKADKSALRRKASVGFWPSFCLLELTIPPGKHRPCRLCIAEDGRLSETTCLKVFVDHNAMELGPHQDSER